MALMALPCLLGGCRGPGRSAPVSLRLVDLYKPELVSGRAADGPPPARTEFRFDGPPPPSDAKHRATRGWDALNGISGLAVRDGHLAGRATATPAILHLERTAGLEDHDLVHEIQVRMRASAGRNLSFTFQRKEKLEVEPLLDAARSFVAEFVTPLVPGIEMRTYTLRTTQSGVSADRLRHLLLIPTDAPGATFEVESVRIVFRKEHLASVPSGIGWQGLSEIYRESIVTRSPETLRYTLRVPARARLELSVGTIEDDPVTFRATAQAVRGSKGRETLLLEKTVTRPHRWEEATVDLAPLFGQEVALTLSLASEKPGTIGFWGGPVVRTPPERPQSAKGGQAPQGVILVWADTLRRDHLGAYGYARPTSPVLDRLAGEGVLFRDCVGQASWTKVATPSLLTSLYPSSHGIRNFNDRLPASATTLAEVYREAGYATLSFSSILFTGRFTNLHQGFEEVHEGGSLPDRESSKTAREYVDRLLPWLRAHRDLPFFVFLHVTDPHDPYRPNPPYDTMWGDPAHRDEHERQGKALLKIIADPLLRNMGSPMPTREEILKAKMDPEAYVRQDRDWYDGSIRGMDVEIGRLVEGLRGLGLDQRTLLVFTGDHGEEFLEHGRMFHGQSVYGEMNNMSLIFWGPGVVARGLTVDQTVETVDVMPTLLDLSHLQAPKEAQGESLRALLEPPPGGGVQAAGGWRARPAVSEKAITDDNDSPPPHDTESVALISGGFKLIHNVKRHAGRAEFELFDHRRDPLDAKDLASEQPEVVARLTRELAAWRGRFGSFRLPAETSKDMSPEDLERLRALGYIH